MSVSTPIPDSLSEISLCIAVISPDEQRRDAATSALSECQNGPIREFTSYPSGLNDAAETLGHDYDVVLVDMDSDPECALHLVESISIHGLATAMVYSEQNNPELMLRAMRAGAREYLTLPFAPGAVAEALLRASALGSAVHPRRATDGKLLVFLSAKGGSGVTTLACNYALALAQESHKKILLIDLNLPLGDAAINLGIHSQYSTANALQNSSRLDAHFLSTLLVKHDSGLFVLAAPSTLTPVQVSDSTIERLLKVARQEFDYVVVDVGSRLDMQNAYLFDESAAIYLITQVGIPELRNSNRLITQFSAKRNSKLEIVINRYDPRRMEIGDEQITKALTRPAQWKIPNDYAAVRRMQNTATPLITDDSPISRAIRKMARSVCSEFAAAEQKPEKKKWFRFFG